MQIPNLDNSPINLTSLRDQSQKDLFTILTNIRGKKCLVIDQNLSGSLDLIVQTSKLKEYNVELRYLSKEAVETECGKVVFLVRGQIELMKIISEQIRSDVGKGLQKEYFVYFVPRRVVVCEKTFEEEKVHHLLTIGDYPLYIIPLDEDVLSFELDLACREFQVDGDPSSLWHIANSIHKLESSFGVIPYVRAKGKASVRVAGILDRMQEEEPVISSDLGPPEINTLILLDREVDMVTPMCSQLTYEGLVDEVLRVRNGSVEVDSAIMEAQQEGKKIEGKKTKVLLNSSDKLFKEIRDLNFEVVGPLLRQKTTSMKQDYAEMPNQSVSELKDFVRKLNSLPEISRHINIAQYLYKISSKPSFHGRVEMEQTIVEGLSYDICYEYIEEMVHKQEPIVNVLRLLVLLSITNSGIPKKQFDYLRREVLHSYGFEHMPTLNNLEKAGLFKKQESRGNWQTIRHNLQLLVEAPDTDRPSDGPSDISYVFSGYAPLSIRLVQHAVRSGWRPIEDTLKLLPGPHMESKRSGYSNTLSYGALPGTPDSIDKAADGRRSLVLVVFIGGVTFAEMSALRFLNAQEGMPCDLIVGTTKIVNGSTILETFMDRLG